MKLRFHRHLRMLQLLFGACVLLGGCGRAEQAAEQASPVPLAPATPASTTLSVAPSKPAAQLTPGQTQQAPDTVPAYPFTSAAPDPTVGSATATAEARVALTPEPTILPALGGPRLRDLWPATAQQSAPPARLYLRRYSIDRDTPDTFWEVSLPDGQFRRLPAVEQNSLNSDAQISPDGRWLAYVTGDQNKLERTLRVLDLVQNTDRGLALPVTASVIGCSQVIAWSPNGRFLAVVASVVKGPDLVNQLQLYDIGASVTPQVVLELPGFLDLFGWLDNNHLLLSHWKPSVRPALVLSVDRQSNTRMIAELPPKRFDCGKLSLDGQDLIYNHFNQVRRLHLDTGHQEIISLTPKEFRIGQQWYSPVTPGDLMWIGEGYKLLISRQDTQRRVWLRSLDQIEDQPGIFLSPPYQASYCFGVIDVSPDGHFLVACEQPPRDDPRVRIDGTHTWLYSIPDDRWTLLSTKAGVNCDIVIGWASAGEAQ